MICIFILSNFSFAKDYALIVSIGTYKYINNLAGATIDSQTYSKILKRLNIKNIVVLENADATRKNILYQLSEIAEKIEKNDRFYMFFSGHGSSLYDPLYSAKFQQVGLTETMKDTGVIFPYDFNPEYIKNSIIIGSVDLRPLFEKIDKKIENGLIVFDACYSEMSIRNGKQQNINRTPNILTQSSGYPYDNITYIASSITEAKRGKFSAILDECIGKNFVLENVKHCLNRKMQKSFQIPVVLMK